MEGISAEGLLADSGPDTNEIIAYAISAGMKVVIPPKRNRKEQREYDREKYKARRLVENAFLLLKRLQGIAARRLRPRLPSWRLFKFAVSPFGATF